MIYVGDFLSKSGTLRISDPCYDKDTWCAGTVDDCVKGEWEAFIDAHEVDGWGNRVAKLVVKAKGHEAEEYDLLPIDVGVDSGQAGVFDEQLFKSSEGFYEACCSKTLSSLSAGTIEYGAVSSSGLGDGSYAAFAGKNKAGQVCEIEIDFQLDDEDYGEYND
jgi:hypothetical protein